MIEVANGSLEKDTEEKRLVYAQADLPEYWVVNLRDRCVSLYSAPFDGDYRSERQIPSGTIAPSAFPDVVISIHQLSP